MKFNLIVSLFIAALTISFSDSVFAESHDHHHEENAKSALKLNNGKKWKTDAPLKAAMTEIKSLIEKNIGKIHEEKMKDEEFVALSDAIKVQLDSIFKNCKLPPKTDQMVHVVLLKIIEGNNEMKEKASAKDRHAGTVKIVEALSEYGKYFAHPGWKKLKF